MRTRAAVLFGFNQPFKIQEVELEGPRSGELLVRMVASGICHTDVSVAQGVISRVPLPAILGHEGAGIVQEVSEGSRRFQPGDHVVMAAEPHCGHCRACLQGKPFHCVMHTPWAFDGAMPDGSRRFRAAGREISHFFCESSFSEFAVIPEHIAVLVPSDLPLEKLCTLGCGVQTGAGAVLNTARVQMGESVAVLGCGGVGLSAVMGARLARALPIIAVDVVPSRLELAQEFGASHAVNAAGSDVVEEIRKITGRGADYAFECVGKAETIRQAVDSVRPNGGTAVITGAAHSDSDVKLDAFSLIMKNVVGNIQGSSVPEVFLPMLIEFWRQGQFPFDRLSPQTYALDQINEAIADMLRGAVIKPVIRMSG